MFSESAFCELPFADLPASALSASGLQTFYLSTNGYTSGPSDSVADQYFDARVEQALEFERAIPVGERLGGLARGQGALSLLGGDRGLDSLLTGFALNGRRVTVRHGRDTFDYGDFGVLFRGVIVGASASPDVVRFDVRDALDNLDVPLQTTYYAGTGGNEGGDDLAGKPKPILFGQAFNIPAVLVDAANNVYQVAAHQINAVTAVRDRGVALNAAPSGVAGLGEYEVDLATGLITLGGSPDGEVTVDAQGHASPTYVSTTASILLRVLQSFAGLDATEIDLPSFATLESDSTATVGLWIGTESRTIADVIDELLGGIGAFGAVTRAGKISASVFKVPSGAPVELTQDHIIEIERDQFPSAIYPPSWRQSVGWQRNYQVQTDIAGSVDDATRAAISQPYRIAAAADASQQIAHLLARDVEFVPSLFASESDASTEASRLQALYGVVRSVYRVRLGRVGFGLELGSVVSIDFPAWDLDGGAYGRVLSIRYNAAERETEIGVLV